MNKIRCWGIAVIAAVTAIGTTGCEPQLSQIDPTGTYVTLELEATTTTRVFQIEIARTTKTGETDIRPYTRLGPAMAMRIIVRADDFSLAVRAYQEDADEDDLFSCRILGPEGEILDLGTGLGPEGALCVWLGSSPLPEAQGGKSG